MNHFKYSWRGATEIFGACWGMFNVVGKIFFLPIAPLAFFIWFCLELISKQD